MLIWIRRFLCRACQRTISVLPDSLYPGRWYAAIAILTSLTQALLGGVPAWKIQERFSGRQSRDWKTLERWQRQLLAPLWDWFAGQLGFVEPACDRGGRRSRLQRLLSLHGASGTSPPETLADVARTLLYDTAHSGSVGRDMRRGQPSNPASRRPRRARR